MKLKKIDRCRLKWTWTLEVGLEEEHLVIRLAVIFPLQPLEVLPLDFPKPLPFLRAFRPLPEVEAFAYRSLGVAASAAHSHPPSSPDELSSCL